MTGLLESPAERIIVPLDVNTVDAMSSAVSQLAGEVGVFKIGYEVGYSVGWADAAAAITDRGEKVFVDAKLDDIPNTVGSGARSIAAMDPTFITTHASAGVEAMRAAVANKGTARILAVTVLTSIPDDTCHHIFGARTRDTVRRFAHDALAAGVDGIVCSPQDLDTLSADEELGSSLLKVTPGVRPTWATNDDQARIMTPRDALRAGADYLVIGRPILRPPESIGSPVEAARKIASELEEA